MKKEINRKETRKQILNVIYIFLGLFVLVVGYFSYFMIVRSNEVINNTYNKRHDVLSERVQRGMILASQGEILARTVVDEKGNEIREYPYKGMFVHVVGRMLKGRTGLEETENIRLLTSDMNSLENMYEQFIGKKNTGNNIITTLNVKLQEKAYQALGNNRGAVVVLEPKTGKILAMVSKPDYNPNEAEKQWVTLLEDPKGEAPFLNRATQGLYPPGSTFKLITSLAYMRENPDYQIYHYRCEGKISNDDMDIRCYRNNAHGEVDLPKSLAKSCNSSFASIGRQLDLDLFHNLCEELQFNKRIPINLASNPSSFTLRKANSSVNEAMQTAIGQGKTLMTPLHNALIAATVANGGIMMKPYLVDRIENGNGTVIKRYGGLVLAKPMSLEEADYLSSMMRFVVTDGTASELKKLKVEAAGKTGSADQANKPAHAWFVGFAPYDDPQIAISVIVESKGTGSDFAVPIARKVFDAYFNNEN